MTFQMRGPYDNTKKSLAKCICRIKSEKGEIVLNSNQLSEECDIPFRTAERYVDSSAAEEYQRELNLTLKETCTKTQVKRKCDRWALEVDDPIITPLKCACKRDIAALCAISLLTVGAVGAWGLISLGSRRRRELRLRHEEEDRTLDHKAVNGENFIDVCDSCFYHYGYDVSQTWEHLNNVGGVSCFRCNKPATYHVKAEIMSEYGSV